MIRNLWQIHPQELFDAVPDSTPCEILKKTYKWWFTPLILSIVFSAGPLVFWLIFDAWGQWKQLPIMAAIFGVVLAVIWISAAITQEIRKHFRRSQKHYNQNEIDEDHQFGGKLIKWGTDKNWPVSP